MLHFSMRSIVRMFEHEPGILVRNGERRTFRIPHSVYERVRRRMTVK